MSHKHKNRKKHNKVIIPKMQFFHFRKNDGSNKQPYKISICGLLIGRHNQNPRLPMCPNCLSARHEEFPGHVITPYGGVTSDFVNQPKRKKHKIVIQSFAPAIDFE